MKSCRVVSEVINTENIYGIMNAVGVEIMVIEEAL
jgi:hypothetical protein